MKSNEIKWNQMKSNEIKWNQMKSNEIKWNQPESFLPFYFYLKKGLNCDAKMEMF